MPGLPTARKAFGSCDLFWLAGSACQQVCEVRLSFFRQINENSAMVADIQSIGDALKIGQTTSRYRQMTCAANPTRCGSQAGLSPRFPRIVMVENRRWQQGPQRVDFSREGRSGGIFLL